MLTERKAWLEILERRTVGEGRSGLCIDTSRLRENRLITSETMRAMDARILDIFEPQETCQEDRKYGGHLWSPFYGRNVGCSVNEHLPTNTVRMTAICFILAILDGGF